MKKYDLLIESDYDFLVAKGIIQQTPSDWFMKIKNTNIQICFAKPLEKIAKEKGNIWVRYYADIYILFNGKNVIVEEKSN